jgi:trehalose utilization protein
MTTQNRRNFLKDMAAITSLSLLPAELLPSSAKPAKAVRVLVWDERQPAQQQVYDNFLGNEIAGYLRKQPGFSVTSVCPDDPGQGLSDTLLNNTDVLIWWGHKRQAEISAEKGRQIVERIVSGSLSFIALHSAHWATPFVEAMNYITRERFEKKEASSPTHKRETTYVIPPKQYTVPKYDSRLTPYAVIRKYPDGKEVQQVHLPFCCFPAYRNDGKPSTMKVLKRSHPVLKNIPSTFELPQTEMYDEPFHVPAPDEVLLEERWAAGEWFRSGMIWQIGKGKLFYFRPGHETFPVYKEKFPLQILANAALWMGRRKPKAFKLDTKPFWLLQSLADSSFNQLFG